MPDPRGAMDAGAVDLAMNEVLAAERDARKLLEGCRAEARLILDEAEARARRISERAQRRAGAANRIADAAVERALRGLNQTGSHGLGDENAGADRERLARAVDRLMDEIVGGPP